MVYILIIFIILTIELIIKSKVVEMSDNCFPIEKCDGKIRIIKVYNEGMACNILEDKPEKVKKYSLILLVIFSILSAPLFFSKKARKIRKLGAALLIGGAASNVIDRCERGKVVDYLQFNPVKKDRLDRMTYNIADFCIIAGIIMYGMGKKKIKKQKI